MKIATFFFDESSFLEGPAAVLHGAEEAAGAPGLAQRRYEGAPNTI